MRFYVQSSAWYLRIIVFLRVRSIIAFSIQLLWTFILFKRSSSFKKEKCVLYTKTGLVLSVLPHLHRSVLIIVVTLLKTHFKSMSNNLFQVCSDRNDATATEPFPKIVRFHDLLSTCLHSLLGFPDVPFQTILLQLELLASKCQRLVSECGPHHQHYTTLNEHTQVPHAPYLPDM